MSVAMQVLEVRDKIMERKMSGEKLVVTIDEGLIADAHKMGRYGIQVQFL